MKILFKRKRQAQTQVPQLDFGEPFVDGNAKKMYVGGVDENIPIPSSQDIEQLGTTVQSIDNRTNANNLINSINSATGTIDSSKLPSSLPADSIIVVKSGNTVVELNRSGIARLGGTSSTQGFEVTADGLEGKASGNTISNAVLSNCKVGTTSIGSANTPVYVNNGTITVGTKYAGGTNVTLNGNSVGGQVASFYAPTSAGASGRLLQSSGSGAPTWKSDSVGSANLPVYISSGVVTAGTKYAGGTSITLNGTGKGGSNASFYAPTSAGTDGYVLTSSGSGAPTWQSMRGVVSSKAPTGAPSSWTSTITTGNSSHSGSAKSYSLSASLVDKWVRIIWGYAPQAASSARYLMCTPVVRVAEGENIKFAVKSFASQSASTEDTTTFTISSGAGSVETVSLSYGGSGYAAIFKVEYSTEPF